MDKITELIAALNDEKRSVVREAADELIEIGSAHVVEALIVALSENDNSRVRREAAYALGRIGNVRALNS